MFTFRGTLQMFTGDLRGSHRFSLQYLWKRAVRITEKLYTALLYFLGKPCNSYRLQGSQISLFIKWDEQSFDQ